MGGKVQESYYSDTFLLKFFQMLMTNVRKKEIRNTAVTPALLSSTDHFILAENTVLSLLQVPGGRSEGLAAVTCLATPMYLR